MCSPRRSVFMIHESARNYSNSLALEKIEAAHCVSSVLGLAISSLRKKFKKKKKKKLKAIPGAFTMAF